MARDQVLWSREAMEACTTGHSCCAVVGCTRSVYRSGRCSDHWERPEAVTCGHDQAFITCGCCGREVCADCYGEWNVLACHECRERARATP